MESDVRQEFDNVYEVLDIINARVDALEKQKQDNLDIPVLPGTDNVDYPEPKPTYERIGSYWQKMFDNYNLGDVIEVPKYAGHLQKTEVFGQPLFAFYSDAFKNGPQYLGLYADLQKVRGELKTKSGEYILDALFSEPCGPLWYNNFGGLNPPSNYGKLSGYGTGVKYAMPCEIREIKEVII